MRRATRYGLAGVMSRLSTVGAFNHSLNAEQRMIVVALMLELVNRLFDELDTQVPDGGEAKDGRGWADDDPTNTIFRAPLATRVFIVEMMKRRFKDMKRYPDLTVRRDDESPLDSVALKQLRGREEDFFPQKQPTKLEYDKLLLATYPFGA